MEHSADEDCPGASVNVPADDDCPGASVNVPTDKDCPSASVNVPADEDCPGASVNVPTDKDCPNASVNVPADEDCSGASFNVEAEEETDGASNIFKLFKNKKKAIPKAAPPPGDYTYSYNMNHKRRGRFFIINNKCFDTRFHPDQNKLSERRGTDVDAEHLEQQFTTLGFQTERKDNLSACQMLKLMRTAAGEDHADRDCFACAILSHGDDGVVYGTDGVLIQIDMLVAPFKGDRCPSLVGKPKLFFIQACRGDQMDDGVQLIECDTDDEPQKQVYRIPSEADFFFAYSTVPGYCAWRNEISGSWFIQALCQTLKEHGLKKEFQSIMTCVNRMVAHHFESHSSIKSMNRKKQMPSMVSMLTKELVFTTKN